MSVDPIVDRYERMWDAMGEFARWESLALTVAIDQEGVSGDLSIAYGYDSRWAQDNPEDE